MNGAPEDFRELSAVHLPKTGEIVAQRLRVSILRGKLKEGDILPPETDLAGQLGVSRPAVREALRLLESEGLVIIRRGRNGGGRVTLPSVQVAAHYTGLLLQSRGAVLDDVLATRLLIEPEAVVLLTKRNEISVLSTLRDIIVEEALAIDDSDAFVRLSTSFHEQIAAGSGSPTLEVIVNVLTEIIEAHLHSLSANRPIPPEAARVAVRAHTRLIDLIEERDADAAGKYWHDHLSGVSDLLVSRVGPSTVLDVLGTT